MSSLITHIVVLGLFFFFFTVCQAALTKTTVRVINDLGPGVTLYSHCRSTEDDLGPKWPGVSSRSCKVFDGETDEAFCGSQCDWYVQRNRACQYSHKTNSSVCVFWPTNPKGLEEEVDGAKLP
ncbi:unnamed protein product [Ilex paraguariensis]|uniref:S-protein homolog n=1 Tax=Ilex paraguariensis TaxID=185542 RepID=A0ABC8RIU2_9AQUA